MEELLNKLIEKGWKPRGKNAYNCCDNAKRIWYEGGEESYRDYIEITPRKLTSKESGLWQFVCENKMVRIETYSLETDSYRCYYNYDGYPKDNSFEVERNNYRFRLLESSLIDESELEKFLLDNINV